MPVETGGSSTLPLPTGAATSSNQTLALTALDDIFDALALVGQEATNVQIRDAVTGLGDGASLADLAAAFSDDAVVQADILAALEASEINIAATKAGIDLLVPDLDAVRIATEATLAKLPAALVGGRLDVILGSWLGSTAPTVGQKTASSSIPVVLASPGSSGPVPLIVKTVPTGTAEAVATSTPVAKFVRVQSDFANTKTIYVSGSAVTVGNGQQLGPGDVYTYTDVDNANLIYCISADAAQILRIEVL